MTHAVCALHRAMHALPGPQRLRISRLQGTSALAWQRSYPLLDAQDPRVVAPPARRMAMNPDQFHEFLAAVMGRHGGGRDSLDLRGMDLPGCEGIPVGWGAGHSAFKRGGATASRLTAYSALMSARRTKSFRRGTGEGFGAEDLRSSAKLFAVLGQKCRGEALVIFKRIGDPRGVYAWLRPAGSPMAVAGRVRLFEQVARLPQVKYAGDVEATFASWREAYRRIGAGVLREAFRCMPG